MLGRPCGQVEEAIADHPMVACAIGEPNLRARMQKWALSKERYLQAYGLTRANEH